MPSAKCTLELFIDHRWIVAAEVRCDDDLKYDNGDDNSRLIELSPLYDFAPMVLDPQGIPRVCRWRADKSDVDGGYPTWSRVAETLDPLGLDGSRTKKWLREMGAKVHELPGIMRDEGVPHRVIETLDTRIGRVARALEETR